MYMAGHLHHLFMAFVVMMLPLLAEESWSRSARTYLITIPLRL